VTTDRTADPFTLETPVLGALIVPEGAAHAAEIEELSRRAAVYATRARGERTRRAYRSAWRHCLAFCDPGHADRGQPGDRAWSSWRLSY